MSAEAEYRRESLLVLYGDELSAAYSDARSRFQSPVLLVVDPEDSLGRVLCQQHGLKDPLNILPLSLEDALEWLQGASPVPESRTLGVARDLLDSAAQEALRVIVIAFEGASFRCIPLSDM